MTSYDHNTIPEHGNLRGFITGQTDEYGDGVAEILSIARKTIEGRLKNQNPALIQDRLKHLSDAEDAYNLENDIDGVRDALAEAFRPV